MSFILYSQSTLCAAELSYAFIKSIWHCLDEKTDISRIPHFYLGTLYSAKKYLTSPAMLYPYKRQILPKVKYCCPIWPGAANPHYTFWQSSQLFVEDDTFSALQPISNR